MKAPLSYPPMTTMRSLSLSGGRLEEEEAPPCCESVTRVNNAAEIRRGRRRGEISGDFRWDDDVAMILVMRFNPLHHHLLLFLGVGSRRVVEESSRTLFLPLWRCCFHRRGHWHHHHVLSYPPPGRRPVLGKDRVDFWNEKREIKTLRLRLRGKRESEGENLCSRGIMWLWSHRDLCRAREWKGTTWWVGLGLAGHACVRTLGRGAFIIDNCSRKGGTDVPEHRASEKSLSLLCVWYFAREGRSFRAHLI